MFEGLTKLVKEGDEVGVRRMLEQGTSVDDIGDTLLNASLHIAAWSGHLEIVKILLAAGANVNHVDHDGFSPVNSAAGAGKWAVVTVLAEHGGDFQLYDATGRNGHDYLRRCRGKRIRAEIEAVLARRSPAPASDETTDEQPS